VVVPDVEGMGEKFTCVVEFASYCTDNSKIVIGICVNAVDINSLQQALEQQLQSDRPGGHGINLDGAENTAKKLAEFIITG